MARIRERDPLLVRVSAALDGAKPGTARARAADDFNNLRMEIMHQVASKVREAVGLAEYRKKHDDRESIEGYSALDWLEIIPSVANADETPGAVPEDDLEAANDMVFAVMGLNHDDLLAGQADPGEIILGLIITSVGIKEICQLAQELDG